MEIGVLVLFAIIASSVIIGEKTKVGNKLSEWCLKNLIGINVDEAED